jgi:preprotein translocase subunit SecE
MSISENALCSLLTADSSKLKIMNKLQKFLKDSWVEVTENVTWPKWSELQASSTLVLVASLIFALVVGLIDFLFKSGLELFYQSF